MMPWIIEIAIIAAVVLVAWGGFAWLNKKGGEKRMIGILEKLAFFRGTAGPNNVPKFH